VRGIWNRERDCVAAFREGSHEKAVGKSKMLSRVEFGQIEMGEDAPDYVSTRVIVDGKGDCGGSRQAGAACIRKFQLDEHVAFVRCLEGEFRAIQDNARRILGAG